MVTLNANIPLTGAGVCSYNGITFSPYQQVTLHCEPVYDAAERTVVSMRWTVHVVDVAAAGPADFANDGTPFSVEPSMLTIRQALEQPAAELHVDGKGFGGLAVNVPGDPPGSYRDCNWGPKPRLLNLKPRGQQGACYIEWECTTEIIDCAGGALATHQIMEANYKIQWQIDFGGYTRRTYAGYIRIPVTRPTQDQRQLQDWADAYRQNVMNAVVCPVGFRREADFNTNEAKNILEFTISDVEMAAQILQDGVVECEASHEVENSDFFSSAWQGTVSATYEMAKDVPRSQALLRFYDLLNSRGFFAVKQNGGAWLGVRSFRMSEPEIFGKKCAHFEATYMFTIPDPNAFVGPSGLWTPVPGTSWGVWKASMHGIFQAQGRGYANLVQGQNDDVIVDMCNSSTVATLQGGYDATLTAGGPPNAGNSLPSTIGSFLHVQMEVKFETDDSILETKDIPLSANPGPVLGQSNVLSTDPAGGFPSVGPGYGYYPPGIPGSATLTTTQQRTLPGLVVRFSGRGIRVGYLIDNPVVNFPPGMDIVQANQGDDNGFKTAQVAAWFGLPVIAADWDYRFVVRSLPVSPLGVIAGLMR